MAREEAVYTKPESPSNARGSRKAENSHTNGNDSRPPHCLRKDYVRRRRTGQARRPKAECQRGSSWVRAGSKAGPVGQMSGSIKTPLAQVHSSLQK